MTFNLSKDEDYHTQRNNIFIPLAACNATSGIMFLKASKIKFNTPKDIATAKRMLARYGVKDFAYPEGTPIQEEDYLISILRSPKAYEVMRKIAPWAIRDGYPPNEVHAMLAWGINEIVGREVDYFTVHSTMKEWVYNIIIKECAVIISGSFTKYGHIVCLAGVETTQRRVERIKSPEEVSLNKIKHFIVDDPYGNYHTGYRDVRGNDIKFTLEELADLTKTRHETEGKWAHILSAA